MHLQKKCFRTRNKKANGFTFVEVLVSMLILALTGAVLYGSFSVGLKAVGKSHTEVWNAVQRMQTDSIIRSAAGSVQIPYWVNTYGMNSGERTLEFEWYGGEREHKTIQLPPYVLLKKSELVRGKDNRPLGVRITYTIGMQEYTTSAVFASLPPGKIKL
jgi:prepilin-type N-terminal cleavage/methylation domain